MRIEVDQLNKKLGSFSLSQISFTLPEGYICGLIGRNGAGKTSLLHLLSGVYKQDQGTILIGGKAYGEKSREILDEIGLVLQEPLFDQAETLYHNACFYGSYYKRFDLELMREYLNRFGLMEKTHYGRLSKGEQLKFQFAFALSHQARLLLLDEPTGNFDLRFREEFLCLLKEFISNGKNSVILSTHVTGGLDKVADYILYLQKGKLRLFADVETLRDSYRMIQGEGYKIRLLKKDRILYQEEGVFGTRALVTAGRNSHFDKSLQVWKPTLEELMYGLEKGK